MKYNSGLFLGALLSFFSLPLTARAAVIINEIAWMGTAGSQYSEWIELYNGGEASVSLEGWKFIKAGDQTLFTLTKSIAAKGYLLIERTTASAPDAVPGVADEAGTFGGSGLKNTGDDLTLKDKDGNTVSSALFAGGWPAGDAKTKDTMQWNGAKWISAPGTPDAVNATVTDTPVPVTVPDTSTPAETQTPATSTATSTTATPSTAPVVVPVTVVPHATQTAATATPHVALPVVTVPATTADAKTETAPVITKPADTVAVQKAAVPKPAAKKAASTAKKASSTKAAASDTANDIAADQLQASADVPKENNHTKIIIFGAVAFIGMALFLLLERFKVSKE